MQILKTEIISEVAAGFVMSFPFPSSHTLKVKADELPISAGLKRKKIKRKEERRVKYISPGKLPSQTFSPLARLSSQIIYDAED